MILSFTNLGKMYAQPSMVDYLRECKQILPPPPTTSETTLCEQHPNFVPDEGLNLIGTNFASQLVPPTSGGLSGKNISISGTLLIDRTFQFSNCNIKMDNNAIIAIIDENRLTILNSDIFACEEMWDGIKIETGSRLSMFFSNVEDAEAALQPDENAPMFLIRNNFHRNRVGIRNTDGSAQGGSVIFDLMMRNTFSSDGPLNDGTFAFAGIHLTQTAASIGHSTLTNDFSNIDYGIVSENSDIQVKKCVFENLIETTPVTGFFGGEGIHTSEGTLITDNCDFSNCRFAGIAASGTNLTITNSNFEGDMIVGIVSEDNDFAEEILIKNNAIEMNTSEVLLGISLQRSTASGNSAHNTIDSLRAEKTAVFDALYILDSLRVENPDTINGTFDTVYIAAQAYLLNQLGAFNLAEKNIKFGLDTQRISSLETVKTYLNGISTTFDYETNLKDWFKS